MTDDTEVPVLKYLTVSDTNVYCVSNFSHVDEKNIEEVDNKEMFIAHLLATQALYGFCDLSQLPLLAALSGPRRKRINAACLYVSEQEDETEISLKPLICVRGSVQSVCVADGVVCLLIPERKQLIVYAERQHRATKLDLSIYVFDEKSYVRPCSKGGLYVVTQTHILQLAIHVNNSDIVASVSEIELEKKHDPNDLWYLEYPTLFEILNDKVIAVIKCRETFENQLWYQPLPENIKYLDKEEKFEIDVPEPLKGRSDIHFLQINLPKNSLRCPVDCPHCNYEDKTPSRYMVYDYGRNYYERDCEFNEAVYYHDDSGDDDSDDDSEDERSINFFIQSALNTPNTDIS